MKKTFLLIACATLCFAATESRVPRAQILKIEGLMNDKFRPDMSPDPYDLLGTARGTYLDGYGALFTVEVSLISVPPISPFHPSVTPAEQQSIHDRKAKKLVVMKGALRNLMASAASGLDSLPANEKIAMEAILFSYSFENTRDLPKRVLMSAEKGKLLDAEAKHADLTTVIDEQER